MAVQFIPTLMTGEKNIDEAFSIACGDFAGNILFYKNGLLKEFSPVIAAGRMYRTPWTRDAAFNTWYAGALLCPSAAKNALLSVLSSKSGKLVIDEEFGQYWDIIIWVWGAWNYWLRTGDTEFLRTALEASENTLRLMRNEEFDPADGLFRGGACFQDGIAGYPDMLVSDKRESGIIHCLYDTPRHEWLAKKGHGLPCKALSTNCLYLLAYQSVQKMREVLGLPAEAQFAEEEEALRKAIRARFRNPETGFFTYLLDVKDSERQEGLGLAFGILSGAITGDDMPDIMKQLHVTPNGLPCVWPPYERYMGKPGAYPRHSGLIWPQVNAAWCSVLNRTGNRTEAWKEMEMLAEKAVRDSLFYEIYHPDTGLPYGGLQENGAQGIIEWESQIRQTWVATGFLNMVFECVWGMEFRPDGLSLTPHLPEGSGEMRLSGLRYRGMELDITVRRASSAAERTAASQFIPADRTGTVQVTFVL